MSISLIRASKAFALIFLSFVASAEAQTCQVTIASPDANFASVKVVLDKKDFPEQRAFTFEDSYAGVKDLASRVRDLKTFGADGGEVGNRREAAGTVFTDAPVTLIEYEVDLTPQADTTLGAHVSWFNDGKGLLMAGDLLPTFAERKDQILIKFDLPEGFDVSSVLDPGRDGRYRTSMPENAVFFVSRQPRKQVFEAGGMKILLVIEGDWQYEDGKVKRFAQEIVSHYRDLFGDVPFANVAIFLVRSPDAKLRDRWRAEARGNSVAIVSSPSLYRNLGEQMIHEQLRHELLHLWIPNGINLTGDYSWFYEGFVFYRALIAGVKLRQITFRDVLGSLADSESRALRDRNWKPLASGPDLRFRARFAPQYARGIVTAFAADVAMIESSNGGRDLDDLLRKVFRDARKLDSPVDGNQFVAVEMSMFRGLSGIVTKTVNGTFAPDLNGAFNKAGLTRVAGGGLKVRDRSSRNSKAGRAILKRLGYNERR